MSTLSQFFPAGGNVPSNAIPIELLVVGGGGGTYGAGSNYASGGAGAGRLVYIQNLYVIPGVSYTITVGGGGTLGGRGGPSTFGGQIEAQGGGGSVGNFTTDNVYGGSGGGAGTYYISNVTATTPGGAEMGIILSGSANIHSTAKTYIGPDTLVQNIGHQGGSAVPASSTSFLCSGGGGGAGGPGSTPIITGNGGDTYGGTPLVLAISGTRKYYASGGGGFSNTYQYSMQNDQPGDSQAGPANSGSGAGGTVNFSTATGGSGVVVVAYSSSYPAASTTGSPSTPTRTNYRVYQFTGSGSITFA